MLVVSICLTLDRFLALLGREIHFKLLSTEQNGVCAIGAPLCVPRPFVFHSPAIQSVPHAPVITIPETGAVSFLTI